MAVPCAARVFFSLCCVVFVLPRVLTHKQCLIVKLCVFTEPHTHPAAAARPDPLRRSPLGARVADAVDLAGMSTGVIFCGWGLRVASPSWFSSTPAPPAPTALHTQGQILHLYLFLALVFVAVLVTISETVLVTIYYQLVFEDYRWWWKSVLIPSGMGVYYLLFAAHYYFEVLQVKSYLATWIYCCFCTGMTLSIVLSAGAIGMSHNTSTRGADATPSPRWACPQPSLGGIADWRGSETNASPGEAQESTTQYRKQWFSLNSPITPNANSLHAPPPSQASWRRGCSSARSTPRSRSSNHRLLVKLRPAAATKPVIA